jgi:death-on-curing protein
VTGEPRWLETDLVLYLHDEAIQGFGGLDGLRDSGLLEGALARPRQLHAHDESATLFTLAAAYADAVVRSHAFVDGNKRTALLAARAFLFLNGFRLHPPEAQTVALFEAAAAGTIDVAEVAGWLERNCARRPA